MHRVIYYLLRGVARLLQAFPITWVARLGRMAGGIAWWVDGRHRRVARENLRLGLPTLSDREVDALTHEHFRRLGENYASAIVTAAMSLDVMRKHLTVSGVEKLERIPAVNGRRSCVVAIGHFGNFELYTRLGQFATGYRPASTYRSFGAKALDSLVLSLRQASGCEFFERRTEGKALRQAMTETGLLLGLLCDQHAGDRGLRVSFLGRECSSSTAPAIFALRYHCPLLTAVCYRVGLAKWHIEIGDEIPTRVDGQVREVREIINDVNLVFEAAIRRDPANWFWVHRRWKPAPPPRPAAVPASAPAPGLAATATQAATISDAR